MLVKKPHMPVRHTRVTYYNFLTQGRESYSGELVNASEWNTSLVIHVTCEFMFVFFLNLVPSLNDEKRIEVSISLCIMVHSGYVTVMWLSHNVHFPPAN